MCFFLFFRWTQNNFCLKFGSFFNKECYIALIIYINFIVCFPYFWFKKLTDMSRHFADPNLKAFRKSFINRKTGSFVTWKKSQKPVVCILESNFVKPIKVFFLFLTDKYRVCLITCSTCSCALRASCPTCLLVSCALCHMCYLALRVPCFTYSQASFVSFFTCSSVTIVLDISCLISSISCLIGFVLFCRCRGCRAFPFLSLFL